MLINKLSDDCIVTADNQVNENIFGGGYYKALNDSKTAGESTIFIIIILEVIRDALKDAMDSQNKRQDVVINVVVNVGINAGTNEEKVLAPFRQDSKLTAKTLASTLILTDRQVERILSKLKVDGRIVRHGASKSRY